MHVINHNWSATKQRLHPQSIAEISRYSVLSGDRIQNIVLTFQEYEFVLFHNKLLIKSYSTQLGPERCLRLYLWLRETLTFDLLTPKVDRFMHLPRGPFLPIFLLKAEQSFSK